MMKIKKNSLLQILAVLLILSSFLFSKELVQHKILLEKEFHFDNEISIIEYSNKDINFSMKLLNISNPWSQYLQWKDTIIAVDVPIELGRYCYFRNKNELYIFNLYEYGEEVFQLKNGKISILGRIEDDYNYVRSKGISYDKNDPFKEALEFKNSKPVFFYINKKNKIRIELEESFKVKWKLNKKVEKYFKNFEKYRTPYGNKCLSNEEKKRILKKDFIYGETKNFIECKGKKTPLEEYVCKDKELLLMFKVLTIQTVTRKIDDRKREYVLELFAKEHKEYFKRWKLKTYENNGQIDKNHLCYDLKYYTNQILYWAPIYTEEDLNRVNYNTPKFANYETPTTYSTPSKPLIQKGFGRLYRTRLKKALKEKKPEYAGKHIIAQWGCDGEKNECTTGGVIDASTGKATEFPFKYYAHNGSKEIIYKLNSSLIIFAGDFEFKDGQKKDNKVLFYEFKDGEFLFLKASEYKK